MKSTGATNIAAGVWPLIPLVLGSSSTSNVQPWYAPNRGNGHSFGSQSNSCRSNCHSRDQIVGYKRTLEPADTVRMTRNFTSLQKKNEKAPGNRSAP
ncbi:hypothetical protein BDN67DRAFT_969495, partial [Paxillus ammoniavirescens]